MVKKAVFLCVLALSAPLDAGERLAMRVTPNMALEPARLTVRTVVEADSDNRGLEIVAQSADFYRSSSVQLDGASAPRLNVFEFKNLPTGTYEDAERCYKKAIELNPNRPMHYIELGCTYAQMGRGGEARKFIARGLSMDNTEKDDPATKDKGRQVLEKLH